MPTTRFPRTALVILTAFLAHSIATAATAFPGAHWETATRRPSAWTPPRRHRGATRRPRCVIKDGYVVKQWGDQAGSEGLALLREARAEHPALLRRRRRCKAWTAHRRFGWPLQPRHQGITFRHLGAMTSGYARPGARAKPGPTTITPSALPENPLRQGLSGPRQRRRRRARTPRPAGLRRTASASPTSTASRPPSAISPASSGSGPKRATGTARSCCRASISMNT